MELEFVKKSLKIEDDYDDEYLQLLLEVATEYMIDAVGHCDFKKARVKLVVLNIISSLYENRVFTIDKKDEKVAYAIKTIMLQLSLGSGV